MHSENKTSIHKFKAMRIFTEVHTHPYTFNSSYKPTPTSWTPCHIFNVKLPGTYRGHCSKYNFYSGHWVEVYTQKHYTTSVTNQLTPVHFWSVITSALWSKISEQLPKSPVTNRQGGIVTTYGRPNCTSGEYCSLSRYLVRTELSLSLLVTYLPEKLRNFILKHNSANFGW